MSETKIWLYQNLGKQLIESLGFMPMFSVRYTLSLQQEPGLKQSCVLAIISSEGVQSNPAKSMYAFPPTNMPGSDFSVCVLSPGP